MNQNNNPINKNNQKGSFPGKITEHLESLIDKDNPACPIKAQFVPSELESTITKGELYDPLKEDPCRVAPFLIRAYPNRALFLVSQNCPAYCRFCFRKRLVGNRPESPFEEYLEGLDFLKSHKEIDDVILSGGEPFIRNNDFLEALLTGLENIESVKMVRFHTRILTTAPQRVDEKLTSLLSRFKKVKFINTHFNHYRELTPEAQEGIRRLREIGISLNNQSVLLKGVNNSVETLFHLNSCLYNLGVRPYYLFQPDAVPGTRHFRVSLKEGMELHHSLQGRMSGLSVPVYALDAPGIRKVWLNPRYVEDLGEGKYRLTNFKDESIVYDESLLL